MTGVLEDNIRTFFDNWTGTGQVNNIGAGDAECLALGMGEYMEAEIVRTGTKTVTLLQNQYSAGDTGGLQFRHGATAEDCESAEWSDYVDPFPSLGYVQVKVISTL